MVNCTAGWATLIADMAGVRLPISTRPLQAAVTEPVKIFLPTVVVSGSLHVYVSQTDRGELVFGASVDPYATYSMRGSLESTEEVASHVLELMPGVSRLRLLRPYVLAGNDRPGVVLSGAVRRLVNLYAVRPGERAMAFTANPGASGGRDPQQ